MFRMPPKLSNEPLTFQEEQTRKSKCKIIHDARIGEPDYGLKGRSQERRNEQKELHRSLFCFHLFVRTFYLSVCRNSCNYLRPNICFHPSQKNQI